MRYQAISQASFHKLTSQAQWYRASRTKQEELREEQSTAYDPYAQQLMM